MRAIGCREKCTEEVHTSIRTVQFTSEIGKMINRMAKVYKLVIINTHTLANTAKVKNMVSVRCSGRMATTSKEISKITKSRVKENLYGSMIKSTRDNGKRD